MSTRCNVTAEIAGEVIARFANHEDAVFFVNAANEHGLFSITHPGKQAHAYDHRGSMVCCPAEYRSH